MMDLYSRYSDIRHVILWIQPDQPTNCRQVLVPLTTGELERVQPEFRSFHYCSTKLKDRNIMS
ncbi:MAG: hypothetical protein WCF06_13355, partial [Nitrososphaeraceae archaeon]